jgi:hypothetical protein
MKNTLSIILAGLVFCILSGATSVFAEIVEFPLNGCAGTYTVDTPYWTSDFDLGVTFSEISHVYIDWSGEINADLYPGNPDPLPGYGKLVAGIGPIPGEGWLRSASVLGGVSTYPEPEPFGKSSEFFIYQLGVTWDSLLDGKESITIFIPSVAGDPPPISQGSVVLNNATLVVDGTIIPEPATIVFIGLGIMSIRRRRTISSVKK